MTESATAQQGPLSGEALSRLDAWWRAANYLSVGQIYLLDNALLREPLTLGHVKPRLLGHWGTTPGLNLLYAHMNRAIVQRDLSALFVTGPGHGGPGLVASTWLEGSYTEVYPDITRDAAGMHKLFRQFSFPGGIPSHVAPETPGSIHEGGELGYALVHAYGAAFDNPDLLVCCVVGDGEAETGPLAASWHSNKFVDPARDGAVLPVLHLNGYKIANPTLLARIPEAELRALMEGYGHAPRFVTGDDPEAVHQALAAELDGALDEIAEIQRGARAGARGRAPALADDRAAHAEGLDRPEGGRRPSGRGQLALAPGPALQARREPGAPAPARGVDALLPPRGAVRRGGPAARRGACGRASRASVAWARTPTPTAGCCCATCGSPTSAITRSTSPRPAQTTSEATRVLGTYLRDVMRLNEDAANFRVFGPDETASNRLGAVLEATDRTWMAAIEPGDDHLAPDGRVMEVLSEHLCQGWLEGYLLTGRHGVFNCYEAFIHIIDSMFNQHAKWLKVTRAIPWRRPIASLNYLLSSHVWRQDHNGFSHQDPGFIDHVVNKKAEIIRVYLPPDANCLLSVGDHCLRSRNYVNVIVAGKQPALDYLTIDEAIAHCTRGLGIWTWASNDDGEDPDVVLACAGDTPTLEALAAAAILRERLPELRVRFVNVVDLMRLQDEHEHPHGLSDAQFDALFTADRPVIFAYHGYPWLIHRLTYRRANHRNLHVRGYKEEGTTTTPFDMVMLNDMDRYHLVMDVIDRVPGLGQRAAGLRQEMVDERLRARAYTREHGDDPPEVRDWTLPGR